jgi:predicted dehydrogenase
MAKKTLNVAMIGYGFMGRAHSNAYRQVSQFFDLAYKPVLKVACARNPEKLAKFAANWGWESTETDWRKAVERKDVDAIDIGSPNNTHLEIALAAAAAGKTILCEKPLAMNLKEATQMTEAVEKAKVPNFVWFNYRRVPAIALAKQIVDEGRLGRVFHYRACYLQDWTIEPDLPQGGQTLWRLDKDVAGSGVTGDLISHSVDTAIWLNGPMTKVVADTETFIKERALQDDPSQTKPVGIDDACQFLSRFSNGALGLFESTRYARGRKNKNWFEINGANASIAFDLEDPHRLWYYDNTDPAHLQGWRTIHVTGFNHPYMKNWWVPGTTIGYEHTFTNALADFLKSLETDTAASPTFRDALPTQAVCDAVLDSAEVGQWQTVVPV